MSEQAMSSSVTSATQPSAKLFLQNKQLSPLRNSALHYSYGAEWDVVYQGYGPREFHTRGYVPVGFVWAQRKSYRRRKKMILNKHIEPSFNRWLKYLWQTSLHGTCCWCGNEAWRGKMLSHQNKEYIKSVNAVYFNVRLIGEGPGTVASNHFTSVMRLHK